MEKQQITYEETPIRLSADFATETLESEKWMLPSRVWLFVTLYSSWNSPG